VDTYICEGKKAFKEGRYDDARKYYSRALRLKSDDWGTEASLGLAEFMSNKYCEAIEHLSSSIDKSNLEKNDPLRIKLQDALDKSNNEVGILSINVTPSEAKIYRDADGTEILSPHSVCFLPGKHTVRAKRSNYASRQVDVIVEKGQPKSVVIKLGSCETGQRTSEDDEACGVVSTIKPASGQFPLGAVLGISGAALVGLGVGIGFTLKANNDAETYRSLFATVEANTPQDYFLCGEKGYSKNVDSCAKLADIKSSHSTAEGIAVIGFVAGGAAALTAGAISLFWPSTTKQVGFTITPSVSLHHTGAFVAGTF
jgi:tetratricopeptide (TPR) repeat protein